ncbi:hypothetical protein Bca52824_016165 [Brassica carinata]|uniref:Uncharacterized protein n=1 Tax=Brassica carinata TaxID=52824 RepID=A0A8X7W3Z4_BRACI|nr:hypothetical protein Bca52824_016164 [Brassica carinata]KAG2322952.1 hypothetical protein Bca52824_016165 [Brassica carinata]
METSPLGSINVENAFSEVFKQIHQVVSKTAMETGGYSDSGNFPSKGEKIDVDVSAVKKTGCCSN